MQTKKDEIYSAILTAAQAEFSQHGFGGTTMRKIATRAKVTLSNIYNYFKSKDEIFTAVLQPLLDKIEYGKELMEQHIQEVQEEDDDHSGMMQGGMGFILTNKPALRMLLFQSKGSILEDYPNQFKQWYAGISRRDLELESERSGVDFTRISDFSVEFINGIYVDVVIKAIRSDFSPDEFGRIAREMMAYSQSGWQGLLRWKANESE